jgi:hypothetical protein
MKINKFKNADNMKQVLLFLITLSIVTPAFSQQGNTDHLLWFSGKLIKPNVLLTSTGDTIFYNPQKQQIKRVSKSGMGKQFDGMLAELNQTSKRIDEAIKEMTKSLPKPLLPDMAAAVTQAYADVEKQWKPLLSNTYTLPEGGFNIASMMINGKGGPNFSFDEEEDPIEAVLEKIRAFMAKHKNDDLSNLLPLPPRYNFSYCFPCDSIASQRYEKEKDRFIAEIMGAENELYNEALKVCRYIQLMHNTALNEPKYEKVRKQHDEAWAFHDFTLQRAAKRAVLLLDKYKTDPYRLGAVFDFVLMTDRRLQLLGARQETAFGNMNYWTDVMQTWHNFFLNAFNENDYTIALNIRTILKLERARQLIGLGKTDRDMLTELMKFNQFKLNSNITAKVSGNGVYVMGHVRGDNWFYAIPDANTCRLNWALAATTVDRTAKYKLLAAELSNGGKYVGTKDWQSQPPVFKMDFCYKEGEEVADTIFANTFHPEGFREKWLFPPPADVMEVETVSGILMSSFIDVERIQEEAKLLNKDKIEKMQKDMQDKYAKLAVANPSAMVNMSQKMQADMEKLNREIRELLAKANPLKYIFTPQVNNKTKEILKERLNGKEIFPEHSALEYAWFHLTMEHDPDGPHPLNVYSFNNLIQR